MVSFALISLGELFDFGDLCLEKRFYTILSDTTGLIDSDLQDLLNVDWVAIEAKVIGAGLNSFERIHNGLVLLAIWMGAENCVEKLINT